MIRCWLNIATGERIPIEPPDHHQGVVERFGLVRSEWIAVDTYQPERTGSQWCFCYRGPGERYAAALDRAKGFLLDSITQAPGIAREPLSLHMDDPVCRRTNPLHPFRQLNTTVRDVLNLTLREFMSLTKPEAKRRAVDARDNPKRRINSGPSQARRFPPRRSARLSD